MDKKNCWEMTNTERVKELWNLLYRADEILESFSKEDHKTINTGAVYCLPNCIKWGLQGIGELKGLISDESTKR